MREIVVTVKQGQLRGAVVQNIVGGSYLHFKGIPYAAPPVGELRFKDPRPPQSWTGIRDALKEGPICVQRTMGPAKLDGDEDCLYLNVATTSLSASRPVMFWIHGGAFVAGSGGTDIYSPDYLIKEDIVFVSFNYRLGVFGFLNLDPELAPGNMGLKDQVAALKWVKENISQFGGDPDNVTIFGESAGGAAVHLHTLSPMSKGLFHKAIAQSGVMLNPWVISNKNRGYLLVETLGKHTTDPQEAVEFLRSVPAYKLVDTQHLTLEPEETEGLEFALAFGPTIYEQSLEPFVPRNIEELAEKGVDVPFIIGYTSSEGSIFLSGAFAKAVTLNEEFEVKAPQILIKNCPSKASEVSKELKKLYFGEGLITAEHLDNFKQCVGDIQLVAGILKVAEYQGRSLSSPTYLYKLSYRGTANIARTLFNVDLSGTMHFEDIGHLFYSKDFPELLPEEGTSDRTVSDRFVRMWTNFAKTGDPTPWIDDLITEKWKPVSKDTMNYLDIGSELEVRNNPDSAKWQAWDRINTMIKTP